MPERTVPCDRCGEPARLSFGESAKGWFESFHCPSCGQGYEADGGPPTPDELRRAILAEQGEWALEATAGPSTALLKALRAALSLSLQDAQRLRDRLPGEVRRGTRCEMERLLATLRPTAEPGALVVRRAAADQPDLTLRPAAYSDDYIAGFLTTEGASLDRYVLFGATLGIGYRNEDGQLMVVIVDENDDLARACRAFLERRGAPLVPRRGGPTDGLERPGRGR